MRIFSQFNLKDEAYISYKSLVSLLSGNGVLLEQYRLQNGLVTSSIGDVSLTDFLNPAMSMEDIEKLSIQMGDDAAFGRSVRKLIANGKNERMVGKIIRQHLTQR